MYPGCPFKETDSNITWNTKERKNLRKNICISNFSSHHILLLFQIWVIQGILLTIKGYEGNSVCECNTKSVGEAKQRIRATFSRIKDNSVHLWFGAAKSALGICTHLYSLKHQSRNIKGTIIWYLVLSMPWKIGENTTQNRILFLNQWPCMDSSGENPDLLCRPLKNYKVNYKQRHWILDWNKIFPDTMMLFLPSWIPLIWSEKEYS